MKTCLNRGAEHAGKECVCVCGRGGHEEERV